jgi:hypothetical protein
LLVGGVSKKKYGFFGIQFKVFSFSCIIKKKTVPLQRYFVYEKMDSHIVSVGVVVAKFG